MRSYLDELDASSPPVPPERRFLAALGPKMLELSRDRSAGAHPYFVPVEHTSYAREIIGPDALLAPEQAVLLETDPDRARVGARQHMERYLQLPNYANNLLRHGFSESDLSDGGSERLADAIVAWGDEAAIAERVRAHHEAGADHVCIQVVGVEPGTLAPAGGRPRLERREPRRCRRGSHLSWERLAQPLILIWRDGEWPSFMSRAGAR
jgi:probable F420-dependent oxidoreductase